MGFIKLTGVSLFRLRSLGLEHLEGKFAEHEITSAEIAYLKEAHLLDMGITSVGDRLRIIESTKAFLRGERNRTRQSTIIRFTGWKLLPCFHWYAPHYYLSESAIVIRKAECCTCSTSVDNVDISSITDLQLVTGCCFAWVYIDTKDPSVKGGKIKVMLTIKDATKVHGTVKNLWEEDQLKMGLRGGAALEEML